MSEPGRVLPHSLDAERAVVGGILLRGQALAEVRPLVDPGDFYHPAHDAIYAAACALDDASKPIDLVTVAAELRGVGSTALKTSPFLLEELSSAVVTVENIAHYARMVRGKATVRRLVLAAQEIAAAGYQDPGDVEAYLAGAERSLLEITSQGVTSSPRGAFAIAQSTMDAIDHRIDEAKRGRAVVGVPSGNQRIDDLLGGFRPGEQYVLAARPSEGKTSLAMQWVLHAARLGVPALVFSLEMTSELLFEHLIAHDATVNSMTLRNGWLDDAGYTASRRTASRLSALPFWILDDSDVKLHQIRAQARRWRAQHTKPDEPALVVLDFLQLVEGDDGAKDSRREREIARFSRGMKKLAKELRVATLVLSQLNRGPEKDEKKPREPRLSDLRESGAIEQDADTAILLHPLEGGITKAIIAKNKNGPKSSAKLRFVREYYRFSDEVAVDDEEAA